MITKIRTLFIRKYPILWNTILIQTLSILFVLHIGLFMLGYTLSEINFTRTYSESMPLNGIDYGYLYAVTIFLSIILLIGWIFVYSRHNGFSVFYPKKTIDLIKEWLVVLLICFSIGSLSLSLAWGGIVRWKNTATLEECNKNLSILRKVDVLIPSDVTDYDFDYREHIKFFPHQKPDWSKYSLFYKCMHIYRSQKDVDYNQVSNSSNYYNIYYLQKEEIDAIYQRKNSLDKVKDWLYRGQTDSIKHLMQEFIEIQKKNHLSVTLTSDEWFKRIYHPPFFELKQNDIIYNETKLLTPELSESDRDGYSINCTDGGNEKECYLVDAFNDSVYSGTYNHLEKIKASMPIIPRLPYTQIKAAYETIYDAHTKFILHYLLLTCIGISIGLSIFIYSFRQTGGKAWLFSVLIIGLYIFANSLISITFKIVFASHDSEHSTIYFSGSFIVLFLCCLGIIIYKIKHKKRKKYTKPILNLVYWLMPVIFPMSLMINEAMYNLAHPLYSYDYSKEEVIINTYISFGIAIAAMPLLIYLSKRWKSLPEE